MITAAIAALLGTAPAALGNGSDSFSGRAPIEPGKIDGVDVSSYTIEANEPHTPNSGTYCDFTTSTSTMYQTAWYSFVASSTSMTVNTFPTDVRTDSVLGVWTGSAVGSLTFAACQDQYNTNGTAGDTSDDDGTDVVTFPTTKGATYALQIGVYCGPTGTALIDCNSGLPGRVFGMSVGPPVNDNVADATVLAIDATRTVGNAWATNETNEPLTCASTSYDATEWFKVTVPGRGRLTFTATGLGTAQTVASLFSPDRSAKLACGQGSAAADVTPGTYFVQVGTVGGFQENMTVKPTFAASADQDGDGSAPPADCNDANPAIPGAEVPNNAVDENCDGVAAQDKDGDGALAPPAGADCNDGNAAIKPGATEVAGDGVDQNCDGADATTPDADGDGVIDSRDCKPKDPKVHPGAKDVPGNKIDEDCSGRDAAYPLIGALVAVTYDNRRITLLRVRKAPPSARAEVRCRGRGCPFSRRRVTLRGGKAVATRLLAGRRLGRGAVVELRVTAPRMIGKVSRVTFGRTVRQQQLCLRPGASRPGRC